MTDQPDPEGLGFDTNAVHGGESADAATGAVNTPVYLSSTFQQDAVGRPRGFEYARSGNPSRASLERHLALLEGAEFGFAFASGLAAEDAVMRLLGPGDHLRHADGQLRRNVSVGDRGPPPGRAGGRRR